MAVRVPRPLDTRAGQAAPLHTLWVVVASALCLLATVACDVAVPPLIDVHDVSPALMDPAETARVRGAGFPEGRPARIELGGQLRCAGSGPPRSVAFAGRGTSESEDTIAFELDAASRSALRDIADNSPHCALVGELRVAFSPELKGAPPVAGTAPLRLDLFPEADPAAAEFTAEAMAEFLGAQLSVVDGAEGVRIDQLDATSRLRVAGLLPGDTVVRVDELRAVALSDLEPSPGQRQAQWLVEREGVLEPFARRIDVAGYKPQEAGRWRWGLALALGFSLALLLTRTAALRAVLFLVLQVRAPRWTSKRVQLPSRAQAPLRATHGLGTFLAVSALFAAMSARAVSWSRDLDIVVLVVASVVVSMLCRLLESGRGGRWSLGAGLMNVVRSLPGNAVIVLCVASAVMAKGSLSFFELGDPELRNGLSLLSSPPMFIAGGTFAAALALQSIGLGALGRDGSSLRRLACRSLELAHLLLLGGLFCVLFLEGLSLPDWLVPSQSRLGSALTLQLQCTGVFISGLALSRVLPVPGRYVRRVYLKRLLPAALLAGLSGPVWSAAGWPTWLRESALLSLPLIALLLALGVAGMALSLWRLDRPRMGVNPWL